MWTKCERQVLAALRHSALAGLPRVLGVRAVGLALTLDFGALLAGAASGSGSLLRELPQRGFGVGTGDVQCLGASGFRRSCGQ